MLSKLIRGLLREMEVIKVKEGFKTGSEVIQVNEVSAYRELGYQS